MDNSTSMRVVQRLADLTRDFESALDINTARDVRIQNICECPAFEPLHDDEIEVVVTVQVHETNDIRMHQTAAFGRLLLQRPQCLAIFRELR